MKGARKFEIFLAVQPGLELSLKAEALECGFAKAKAVPGGVSFRGNWADVWRANLELRGAGRVLARIGQFRVSHLAALDQAARQFNWGAVLRRDVPVRVEAHCSASRIYHEGAARERLERALRETFGVPVQGHDALRLMARIERDICTLSIDTSGEPLHKRGHKPAVGKAPMRETMAALFLRDCGFTGAEPVLDPMCGSGSFVIEAAEMATGLQPGRSRGFAFERLATFDPEAWRQMHRAGTVTSKRLFHGRDRDAGAVRASEDNAARAGVARCTDFRCQPISALDRPEGPPGLIIVNPPYGGRIGERRPLYALYAVLGRVLVERMGGWRVGLITTDAALARATALPFEAPGPVVAHGGLKIRLWQTGPLG